MPLTYKQGRNCHKPKAVFNLGLLSSKNSLVRYYYTVVIPAAASILDTGLCIG